MKPSLYLYKETAKGIELYFNEIATIYGLKSIGESEKIKLTKIGATQYKKFGYATEKEFPKFSKTKELIAFLNQIREIGMIDFEVEIEGKGKMTSHDDGECHFIIKNKKEAIKIIKNIAPENQSNIIISTLLSNKGIYITIDKQNRIQKFSTFEEYLNKTKAY